MGSKNSDAQTGYFKTGGESCVQLNSAYLFIQKDPVERTGLRLGRKGCVQVVGLTSFTVNGLDNKEKTTKSFVDLSPDHHTVRGKRSIANASQPCPIIFSVVVFKHCHIYLVFQIGDEFAGLQLHYS